MDFTSLFLCLVLLFAISFAVLFAARLFASAIANENLAAEKMWDTADRGREEAKVRAADQV